MNDIDDILYTVAEILIWVGLFATVCLLVWVVVDLISHGSA